MSPPPPPRAYLPLHAPHSDLCLTDYLPTDAPQMSRILSDPKVAFNLVGPPYPLAIADAEWWMNGRQDRIDKGEEVAGFLAIRPIKSFLKDEAPTFIGTISLGSDPFYNEPDLNIRAEKVAANLRLKADGGKRWSLGFYLDPSWGGRGIMTTATQTYLEDHIIPTHHIPRSSIRSSAFTDNVASLKVHRSSKFHLLSLVRSDNTEPNAKGRTNFDQYLMAYEKSEGEEGPKWEDTEWHQRA